MNQPDSRLTSLVLLAFLPPALVFVLFMSVGGGDILDAMRAGDLGLAARTGALILFVGSILLFTFRSLIGSLDEETEGDEPSPRDALLPSGLPKSLVLKITLAGSMLVLTLWTSIEHFLAGNMNAFGTYLALSVGVGLYPVIEYIHFRDAKKPETKAS